jgi:hypothetical protein
LTELEIHLLDSRAAQEQQPAVIMLCVGGYSGYGNIGKQFNAWVGAGQSATGNGNIFIGYNAGSYETGSNKLYIANSNTSKPLIYGDFGAAFPFVVINGNGADRTNDSVVIFC